MEKKVATLLMAVAVCLLAIPAISANAVTTTIIDEEENGNDTDNTLSSYVNTPDPSDPSSILLIEDIKVYPAKKTIRIGQSFYINIVAADETKWNSYDEEWDELCENSIGSINYRSTKTSVVSVNKTTGKVVGKKKGHAVIKTTISLNNGQIKTFKTKVYVKK